MKFIQEGMPKVSLLADVEAGPVMARRALPPEEIERDALIARRLGLSRPYVSGPHAGRCPGGAEYGHGMSLTTVHAAGCCAAWDAAHPGLIPQED